MDKRKYTLFGIGCVLLGIIGLTLSALLVYFWTGRQQQTEPPSAHHPQLSSTTPIPLESIVKINRIYLGEVRGWGSGAIISADGLILTNADTVLPNRNDPIDELRVDILLDNDKAPVPFYYARVLQADPFLNMAVIQITQDIQKKALLSNELNLPVISLGDSDSLDIGAPIKVLGYANTQPEGILLTQASLGGYTRDIVPTSVLGERALIKTNALMASVISGGIVLDDNSMMLGVPMNIYHSAEQKNCEVNFQGVENCPDRWYDSNIEYIRPIRFAYPLIAAAKVGEERIGAIYRGEAGKMQNGTVLFTDDFSTLSDKKIKWIDLACHCDEYCTYEHYQSGTYEMQVRMPYADYISILILDNTPDSTLDNKDKPFLCQLDGSTDTAHPCAACPLISYDNVVLSTYAKPVDEKAKGSFGFVCRYQDIDNYVALEVSTDGLTSIRLRQGGIWFGPPAQFFPESVLPRRGENMKITVMCVNQYYTIMVNDNPLMLMENDAFHTGKVGFISNTWGGEGFKVRFDDFVLEQLQ